MSCDNVAQGRLSRSEWRTVDPVAQRPSLYCSTSLHQTYTRASLNNVTSREAVKFNGKDQLVGATDLPFEKPPTATRLDLLVIWPQQLALDLGCDNSQTICSLLLLQGMSKNQPEWREL